MAAPKLCDNCLSFLISKFTDVDSAVLYNLNDSTFVMGYTMKSLQEKISKRADEKDEINLRIKEAERKWEEANTESAESKPQTKPDFSLINVIRPSRDQIYDTLNKLKALTFVDYYKNGKTFCYYISDDGKRALDHINMILNLAKYKSEIKKKE